MPAVPPVGRSPPSRSTRGTSATAAAASLRRGSCGCRARGAREARRWPRLRGSRSPIRRRPCSRRHRSRTRWPPSAATCRHSRSCSGAAVAPIVGAIVSLAGAARPHRGRLARRSWGPQHGRDVAVRQRLGDAVAAGDRCGGRRARRRRARRRPQPRSARARRISETTGIDDDVDRALDGCDRVYVAFDCDVLRPGELAVFMPEPGGPTLAEAEAMLRDDRREATAGGTWADRIARRRRRRARRPARGSSRPVTVRRGARSKMAQMSATDKIDVSIEHKQATLDDGTAKKHPNTCPGCGSHYRDDELQALLRVCPQCGHHFPVRALERIEQLADDGTFVEDETVVALRRSARVLRSQAVYRAPGRGRGLDGLGDAMITGTRPDREPAVPARRDGFLVHGRLDGQRRRREVRPRVRAARPQTRSRSSRSRPRVARACRKGSSR